MGKPNRCINCRIYRTEKETWKKFCDDECKKLYAQSQAIKSKRDKFAERLYSPITK